MTSPGSAELSRRDGKSARSGVPRSSHSTWEPPTERPDPLELLEEQEEHRLEWLLPVRHQRMAESAFTFYRGGAAIMAADLVHTPTIDQSVQLCGDAHLANFGGFASPERRLVFDVNDFDETLPGPWEWPCAGQIQRVLIDTCHFKGNYPDSFTLEATHTHREDITATDIQWTQLIPDTKLKAHTEHVYQQEILDKTQLFTHVRLNIFPDGGVSRMRIFGYPEQPT